MAFPSVPAREDARVARTCWVGGEGWVWEGPRADLMPIWAWAGWAGLVMDVLSFPPGWFLNESSIAAWLHWRGKPVFYCVFWVTASWRGKAASLLLFKLIGILGVIHKLILEKGKYFKLLSGLCPICLQTAELRKCSHAVWLKEPVALGFWKCKIKAWMKESRKTENSHKRLCSW